MTEEHIRHHAREAGVTPTPMRRAAGWSVVVLLLAATLLVGRAGDAGGFLVVTIQPGQRYLPTLSVDPPGVSLCTLSFIYDGTGDLAGRVYVGTAAHCIFSLGDDIALLTGEVFGDVAARGKLASAATDWALIEVRPAFYDSVSPAVVNHPQYPTGAAAPDQTASGDTIQLNDLAVIPRQAQLTSYDPETYRVTGPVIPSDSGGPLVHVPTGAALGIVSQGLNCAAGPLLCQQYEGPTVQGILDQAAGAGFPVSLRTVATGQAPQSAPTASTTTLPSDGTPVPSLSSTNTPPTLADRAGGATASRAQAGERLVATGIDMPVGPRSRWCS